jgi:ABC-type polysaccharide/polyol phosphate transport system ATPase subunit/ABC-type polysaccharide/polyol phosphate export permease
VGGGQAVATLLHLAGALPRPANEQLAPELPPSRVISARSVSKSFRLPHQKYTTIRERVVHPFSREPAEALPALRDVSFDVERGEFLGIVGKNGSGKSTLLKCLSSIYSVDAGEIVVRGRLAPFIELGVGFNEELTGRDNAVINAVMLGLTLSEARERFEEIVAFAELEDFVDLKLKNYSSGMVVRLAFSVTVQVEADVLVFDEVLAVGDAAFERKCLQRFQQLRDEGRTVVLVTHDMGAVERFCDRAMLLHRGELVEMGDPTAIARDYKRLNEDPDARPAAPLHSRNGSSPEARRPRAQGAKRQRLDDDVRVSGPVVAGRDLSWFVSLTWTLAVANFKLRYLDSALSYLWAVMRPLAMFGVLCLFFTQVGRFDNGVEHYPIYLLTSLVLWIYFDQAIQTATFSLMGNQSLLRKAAIPHLVPPLSVVLSSLFDLCLNLLAVLVLLFAFGVEPRLSWAEMPLLILVLSVLVVGGAMLLSALYVRFRDVDQIWLVMTQALFFATPIFYVVASLPDSVEEWALASPLVAIFTEMRHALVDPAAPTAAAAIGGGARLLIPLLVVAGIFALGLWVLRRESPRAAENL